MPDPAGPPGKIPFHTRRPTMASPLNAWSSRRRYTGGPRKRSLLRQGNAISRSDSSVC